MKGDLFMKVAAHRRARVPLACWWGKGLPRRRWVAGLRGWPATLELRHGPDSYGGSSGEYCAMGETLTQQRRVSDEGFRVVKLCQVGRTGWFLIGIGLDGTTRGSTG